MKISPEEKKRIEEMPKVILHLHLDGSLKPKTVYEKLLKNPLKKEEIIKWYSEGKIFENDKKILLEIASKGKNVTEEEVENYLSVNTDCRDLNEYLEKFALPCAVAQSAKDIEEYTYELFEDLAKQNVIYAEVRFAPAKHTLNGETQPEIVEAAIKGMEKAKKEFNIDGNLILCCMRGQGNDQENFETVDVAKKFINKGVCALDLAGAEVLFNTKNFKQIFEKAKKLKIPFTIHAGEADGPESIKTALEFGASRIGHGVRSIEDMNLINLLAESEIPLEICPISNLQTQAVKGKHPLEKLYKKGVRTTINTDNDSVSNTNIIKEYEWVLENTNLKIEDLIQMNKNATRAAFIGINNKTKIINDIENYKKRLENEKIR